MTQMLRSLCKKYTAISEEDIEQLHLLSLSIGHMAELTGADIFIDCFFKNNSKGIVVAEAKPEGICSIYDRSVVGELVEPEKEPAVFTAKQTGLTARDIWAITQENKSVQQVVVPIKNPLGNVIGVLIQEKDISESIGRDKRLQALSKATERQQELLQRMSGEAITYAPSLQDNNIIMKEIHHRVKNNFQMVASILNIQARKFSDPEIRSIFKENVIRIRSFAAIHDILLSDGMANILSLHKALSNICHNIYLSTDCGDRRISINVEGGDVAVSGDIATSVALVVYELVMNSVKHAFNNRNSGIITVHITKGNQYATITVTDNGTGFKEKEKDSFGLLIVKTTVRDKLGGTLRVSSGESGSQFGFDFKIE